ncbi:MAG: precorrin-2 C(20)-methyltransferase [Nitrospirae bacterium]|nr:precorrin-2 C(20)-methyltransferase [Nitrospirota bacterium]
MKKGKLYVIGVGPGDPELLTIKGQRLLNSVSSICVPKGREEGSSLALSIVSKVIDLDGKEIIEAHFPMRKTRDKEHGDELDIKWNETVDIVMARLNSGKDMAFITIGDPTIYSTFFYLYDRLLGIAPDLDVEIVPGVSSINASAARARISLGLADEKIAILPATYVANLKDILAKFDTVVLMKVHRVFDKVVGILDEMGLLSNAVYIARAGMADEKIFTDIRNIREDDLNYFSLMIVRR